MWHNSTSPSQSSTLRLSSLPMTHPVTMWHTPSPCDTLRHHVTHSVTMWHTTSPHKTHSVTGPAPHTVTKHHTPPRGDRRSQVAGSQFWPDISSSLSPPIKTDNVTLPLMYVNETLSAASPVAQFSSFHMRTGLSLSHCTDVGVGFK